MIDLRVQHPLRQRLLQLIQQAVLGKGRLGVRPGQQLIQQLIGNMRLFASCHTMSPVSIVMAHTRNSRYSFLGEHPPLATRFNDVEYRINHRTHSGLARTARNFAGMGLAAARRATSISLPPLAAHSSRTAWLCSALNGMPPPSARRCIRICQASSRAAAACVSACVRTPRRAASMSAVRSSTSAAAQRSRSPGRRCAPN